MSKYRFRLETLREAADRPARPAPRCAGRRLSRRADSGRSADGAAPTKSAALRESQRAALAAPTLERQSARRSPTVRNGPRRPANGCSPSRPHRLAVEVERRRLAVVEADRAVRVLEKLDERRRAEHRKAGSPRRISSNSTKSPSPSTDRLTATLTDHVRHAPLPVCHSLATSPPPR